MLSDKNISAKTEIDFVSSVISVIEGVKEMNNEVFEQMKTDVTANDWIKIFEVTANISLADRDKKLIKKFVNESSGEGEKLNKMWIHKLQRLMKRIETPDNGVISKFLSHLMFCIQYGVTLQLAEILAAQGLMPIQTVEKLREVIRND